jgi:hypothetical protein
MRAGVPEQLVMDLGGWRTRSVFARYNVDLAEALERVGRYVSERAAETLKVQPLRPEPVQSGIKRPGGRSPTGTKRSRCRVAARGVEPRT